MIFFQKNYSYISILEKNYKVYGLKDDIIFKNLSQTKKYQIFEGRYADEVKLLKKFIKPESIIIDLGCNYGCMTLALSQICSAGRVYAFDGSKKLVNCCQETLKANDVTNVEVHCEVLSGQDSQVAFFETPNVESSNFTVSILDNREAPPVNQTNFSKNIRQSLSLESICSKYKINKPEFVKIDCEGSEFEIISGIKDKNYFKETVFLLEFNTFAQIMYKKILPQDALTILFQNFSEVYKIEKNGKLQKLVNIPKNTDNFLNNNLYGGFVDDLICLKLLF